MSRIEEEGQITYYAVNRRGDLRTNSQNDGPNAVTWGVFVGKEIVQPTVVEAVSFMAWKVRENSCRTGDDDVILGVGTRGKKKTDCDLLLVVVVLLLLLFVVTCTI